MVYNESALQNYFVPCNRKHSCQHNHVFTINASYVRCMVASVGCNGVDATSIIMFSDWL